MTNKPGLGLLILLGVMLVNSSVRAQDANPMAVFEKRCPKGQRADDFPAWEYTSNSARHAAEQYAMNHNPKAVFVPSKARVAFQVAGEHAGGYLVILVGDGSFGTSFAMLKPHFPFCADPAELDSGRTDLFTVVKAKLNGVPF